MDVSGEKTCVLSLIHISSEEDYFSDSVTTFDGSALAAVRWKDVKSKEPAVLKVWTDDGCQVMINIENN